MPGGADGLSADPATGGPRITDFRPGFFPLRRHRPRARPIGGRSLADALVEALASRREEKRFDIRARQKGPFLLRRDQGRRGAAWAIGISGPDRARRRIPGRRRAGLPGLRIACASASPEPAEIGTHPGQRRAMARRSRWRGGRRLACPATGSTADQIMKGRSRSALVPGWRIKAYAKHRQNVHLQPGPGRSGVSTVRRARGGWRRRGGHTEAHGGIEVTARIRKRAMTSEEVSPRSPEKPRDPRAPNVRLRIPSQAVERTSRNCPIPLRSRGRTSAVSSRPGSARGSRSVPR